LKAFRATNWLEAMSELKKGHAPDDDNTISLITEKLMTARLGEREAASTLINRMLELNATLTSLGKPMEEIHLVLPLKRHCHKTPIIRKPFGPSLLWVVTSPSGPSKWPLTQMSPPLLFLEHSFVMLTWSNKRYLTPSPSWPNM
jgi:hypothetical protein